MHIALTAKELAIKLMKIHTHGEIVEPDAIVYREADVLALLKELGLPEPDFDSLTEKDFL